jgi:tetratricopeptide (TPR) repeat protein
MDPGLAQAVARDAGADAFITGALLKVGPTQLRLDVRVQDTQSGQIVESEKLEGESVQNIFGMVDSLTARIAGHFLPGGSIPGKAPAIEQAATSNVEAYRHYQLGLEAQNRYLSADAIRELEEAVRLDPQFASAYLHLSFSYRDVGDQRKSEELDAKIEQLQFRLPRHEQLLFQVGLGRRSRDTEAMIRSHRIIEVRRALQRMIVSVARNDGSGALAAATGIPKFLTEPWSFNRGRAHLLLNDYVAAEQEFKNTLQERRNMSNLGFILAHVPLYALLSHFYLGEIYEKTGKPQQAIDEYQSFLSHFEGPRTRLRQVGEARTALNRLIAVRR